MAADSATEDNVAASAEGDEGAGAADDGVWGGTEEQGVEDCAFRHRRWAHPKQLEPQRGQTYVFAYRTQAAA